MTASEDSDLLTHLKLKLTEEQKEEEQANIFNFFPSVIYVFDVYEKKITSFNEKRFTNVLGFSIDELAHWKDHFNGLFFKDDQEQVIADFETCKTLSEKENHSYKCRVNHKDGDVRYFKTIGTVLKRNKKGEATSLLFVSEDITEFTGRPECEEKLLEKINELRRSNMELQEFAYVAAHDLQEPLRKLSTFGERLQSKFSEYLDQEGKVYLDRMRFATDNMRHLIDNLLDFSRIARAPRVFNLVNLNEVLELVKKDLELKIEESATEIDSDWLPSVEAISSQMIQLFDNLVNNAIKFRKKDEPSRINIHHSALSDAEKEFLHLPNKNYFKIVIQDNGIGFEEAYSDRIFQVFQRLHGKAEYPGSGIGLSICKKIVENHQGLIYTESIPDHGASFTIVLPERQI